MSGVCKYQESICPHMTILKGKSYCDATSCQLTGELQEYTKGDAIRAGDDIYISVQISGCIVSYLIQNKILSGTESDHKDLISGIAYDIKKWLKQPVKKDE